jgi:hypothetical protein
VAEVVVPAGVAPDLGDGVRDLAPADVDLGRDAVWGDADDCLHLPDVVRDEGLDAARVEARVLDAERLPDGNAAGNALAH